MLKIGEKPIFVVGISIITSNEAAFKDNTIGKLWENFYQNPIKEKLSNTISSNIFSVYSDYENGDKDNYKVTIGYAVLESTEIPEGLTKVVLPTGNYKIYHPKSSAPEEIIATWQTIWAASSKDLPRNFIADCEIYGENEAVICIGCA